jgi:hypothetical protein
VTLDGAGSLYQWKYPARPPSGRPQTHQQRAQRCRLHIPATSAVTRNFQDFTSFNACFRKVAGGRLVTCDALREPNATEGAL